MNRGDEEREGKRGGGQGDLQKGRKGYYEWPLSKPRAKTLSDRDPSSGTKKTNLRGDRRQPREGTDGDKEQERKGKGKKVKEFSPTTKGKRPPV